MMEWEGDWYSECLICKDIIILQINKNGQKIRQFTEQERQRVPKHNKMLDLWSTRKCKLNQ